MTIMPDTNPSDHSSQLLSPNSAGPAPTWGPPRAPLSPHRLAKLANALGVATPVPPTHSYSLPPFSPPSLPNTSSSATFLPDSFRRSPTPSATSGGAPTPTASTSKYLLHVIPPDHLPHDISDDHDLTPLPPTASGYHTQFRRGVMVPVYPTLQTQLSAIAREYALPSTLGMVLYLITNLPSPDAAVSDEPGPRISDDIWKHIWARVLRAEQNENLTPGPRPFGLGFGTLGRSSPSLLQDVAGTASLRALISPRQFETPQVPTASNATPSPSTPSNSAYSSQSEIDTPESASSVGDIDAKSLPLPGLTSPSLIPILAKVEFDIDRKRAGWYEPWVRSRKVNHAKRAESRMGRSKSRMGSVSDAGEPEEEGTKKAPIDLRLVERLQTGSPVPSFLLTTEGSTKGDGSDNEGYQELIDSPLPRSEDETEEAVEINGDGDPLADVFGTDEETWADLRAESGPKQVQNPNVVELALDAASLSVNDNLEDGDEEENDKWSEAGEVTQLLDAINKPTLSVSIPSSPPQDGSDTATTAATIRRHVPPPLDLAASIPNMSELAVPSQTTPLPDSGESTGLAYLTRISPGTPSSTELEDEFNKKRSPQDEKRGGAFFDELELDIDPSMTEGSEYDENDPNDRRKSQFIMAAQLDEIEKNLAQFSPRQLKPEIFDDSPIRPTSIRSAGSPRSIRGQRSPPQSISSSAAGGDTPSWPAIPFSALSTDNNDDPDRPPSPPRFAFNGISTEPPKSFKPIQRPPVAGVMSDESMARKRELEEEQGLYPPLAAPNLRRHNRDDMDSPIIPLSPDPFGRFPSQTESVYMEDHPSRDSQVFQNGSVVVSQQDPIVSPPDRSSSLTGGHSSVGSSSHERSSTQTPSSRFSFDSVTSEDATKVGSQKSSSSLMGMKNLRRLWRKSGKQSISGSINVIPESGRSSPNMPPPRETPQQGGRLRSKSISKQMLPPSPPAPSTDSLPVPPVVQERVHMQPLYQKMTLDGERYPPSREPSPMGHTRLSSLAQQRPPSAQQQRPPSAQQQRPPSVQHSRQPSTSQQGSESKRESGVRKSILKSWKSATGLSASSKHKASSSTSTPRSSAEQPLEGRRRRPSVIDLANGMRASTGGSPMLADIPPSPALPEQYANFPPPTQSRASSRQSQLTLNSAGGDKRPDSSRRGLSVSSLSTTSSPPRGKSPLMVGTSPPRGHINGVAANQDGSRLSDASWEDRPSFDVSQFEMVSPPRSTLSYPYHGLDQSMTSTES